MIIHHDIASIQALKNAVVTIGTFDGVHLGHQKILNRIITLAKATEGETCLVTFWPHPRFVLQADEKALKLLSTFDEKAETLRQIGIDHLLKIEFTKEFSRWSSETFIQKILIEGLNTKKLVIGYDHHFGKNREGGFEYLQQNAEAYGFSIEEISRQDIDNVGISSTKIRNALARGDVKEAAVFLGRPYNVNGFIKAGDKIGRTLGFPTANVQVGAYYKLIPADGTYAVKVKVLGKMELGMLNIGSRPTVEGKEKRMEVNIFDFDQDIYDQQIEIFFIERLRAEKKFDSKEGLIDQLKIDQQKAQKILSDTTY